MPTGTETSLSYENVHKSCENAPKNCEYAL